MCELVADLHAVPICITIPALGHEVVDQETPPKRKRMCNRAVATRHLVNSQLHIIAQEFGGSVVDLFAETSTPAPEGDWFQRADLKVIDYESDEDHSVGEAGKEQVPEETVNVMWMRDELCSDGLHFSKAGYQRLAQLVQACIEGRCSGA